jgi:hypothetical protein
MTISAVSPSAAALSPVHTATKPAPAPQPVKPAAPPAAKSVDTDGDSDRSGGVNVKV